MCTEKKWVTDNLLLLKMNGRLTNEEIVKVQLNVWIYVGLLRM